MIEAPSGLVAFAVMVEVSPDFTVVGLAEQLTTGGSGCLTVKFTVHLAGGMGSGLPIQFRWWPESRFLNPGSTSVMVEFAV